MVRRAYPVRTCVGCRKRAPASDLLRVVAVRRDPAVTGGVVEDGDRFEGVVEVFDVVPDPARRLPGRGAHLHVDPGCLAQAARRRALGRALRVTGVTETGRLAGYLETRHTDGVAGYEAHRWWGAEVPARISKVGRPT